jgi:hypothetical protein
MTGLVLMVPLRGVAGHEAAPLMEGKCLIVTAVLGSILVAVAIGFAGSAPYGLAASQFGGRMSFTVVGMQMLLALLAPWGAPVAGI